MLNIPLVIPGTVFVLILILYKKSTQQTCMITSERGQLKDKTYTN